MKEYILLCIMIQAYVFRPENFYPVILIRLMGLTRFVRNVGFFLLRLLIGFVRRPKEVHDMTDKPFEPEFFIKGKCQHCSNWSQFEANQSALAYIGAHGYTCHTCLEANKDESEALSV